MEQIEDARTSADTAQVALDEKHAAKRDRAWTIYHTHVWKRTLPRDRSTIERYAERIIDAITKGMDE